MSENDTEDPKGSKIEEGSNLITSSMVGTVQPRLLLTNYMNIAERLEDVRQQTGHSSLEYTLDTFLQHYEVGYFEAHPPKEEYIESELCFCQECLKAFESEDDRLRCSECR